MEQYYYQQGYSGGNQYSAAEGGKKKRATKKKGETQKGSKSNNDHPSEHNNVISLQMSEKIHPEINADLINYSYLLEQELLNTKKKLKYQRKNFRNLIHNLSKYFDSKGINASEIDDYIKGLAETGNKEFETESDYDKLYNTHKYILIDSNQAKFKAKKLQDQEEQIEKDQQQISKQKPHEQLDEDDEDVLNDSQSKKVPNVEDSEDNEYIDQVNEGEGTQKQQQQIGTSSISKQSESAEKQEKPKRGRPSTKKDKEADQSNPDSDSKKKRGKKKKEQNEEVQQQPQASNSLPANSSSFNPQNLQGLSLQNVMNQFQIPQQQYHSGVQQQKHINISPSKESGDRTKQGEDAMPRYQEISQGRGDQLDYAMNQQQTGDKARSQPLQQNLQQQSAQSLLQQFQGHQINNENLQYLQQLMSMQGGQQNQRMGGGINQQTTRNNEQGGQ